MNWLYPNIIYLFFSGGGALSESSSRNNRTERSQCRAAQDAIIPHNITIQFHMLCRKSSAFNCWFNDCASAYVTARVEILMILSLFISWDSLTKLGRHMMSSTDSSGKFRCWSDDKTSVSKCLIWSSNDSLYLYLSEEIMKEFAVAADPLQ